MAGWRFEDNKEDVMQRATAIVDKYPQLREALGGSSGSGSGGGSTPTPTSDEIAIGKITVISSEPTVIPPQVIPPQIVNPIAQQTAWQTIMERQQSPYRSTFSKWYDKLDYGFGGFLPAGLPRTLVKSADRELRIPLINLSTRTAIAEQEAKMIKDFTTESWYEKWLGIGTSPAETAYQARETVIRENVVLEKQNTFLEDAGFSSDYGLGFSSGSTNPLMEGLGTGLKWAIPLGVIAIVLLNKKNKR